jgi:subtilisin-like proprotein convertase family protein
MKLARRPFRAHSRRSALRAGTWRALRLGALEELEFRCLLSISPATDPALAADPILQPSITLSHSGDMLPLVGSSTPYGLSPAQVREAYGLNNISFAYGQIQGDGSGQTVAIIVAYHYANLKADLDVFSAQYGLPDPPSFKQVAQDGTTNYPGSDQGWALETCLDVQWVHAMAPRASIIVVEAVSASTLDMISAAANWARQQPNVSVVSMSFGAAEFVGQTGYDNTFTTPAGHSGVTFVAATGDTGNPGTYPAFSPNVLAVGGTTLTLDGANHITDETGWSGSGGGVSQYESQPSYQSSASAPFSTTKRTTPDVAFDANPSAGFSVYNSTNPGGPWVQVGGTSASAPAWAGLIAVANQGRYLAGLTPLDGRNGVLPELYASASAFRDIINGSNGSGSDKSARPGYDMVTGLGSPYADKVTSEIIGSSSIAGRVFNDLDSSGTQNSEPGLQGWTVYADFDNDATLDGASSATTFNSTDTPKTIPATTGSATSVRNIAGLSANILDVNVTVNISHGNDSDLVLTLTSPAGISITLASHVGGSDNNFTNTKFDDSALTTIALGTAPFTGSFQPATSLAKLIGTSPNGNWTLQVQDTVFGTGGTLTSWSLQIVTGDAQTTTDAAGDYRFTNMPTGTYRIREVLQSPYVQTAPGSGFYTLPLAASTNLTGRDFGNHLPASAAPSGLVLAAPSDTGASNADGVTRLNNSSPATALQYLVADTIVGATVYVYSDGTLIGTAVAASGTSTTVTTDGTTVLSPGPHAITAQQTEPGKPASPLSPLTVTQVDISPPSAAIDAVSPNPRAAGVTQMTITFNEAVTGLDITDLALARDGGADLLSAAQTLSTSDGITWTLGNLSGITATAGQYQLQLTAAGSGIADIAGNSLPSGAGTTFLVTDGTASIQARQLFYKDSTKWNVTNANLPGFSDDNAIAPDKSAYLPGAAGSTFANVSTYMNGINGIMVDLAGVHGTITANDFEFKVGNNNSPSSWGTPLATANVMVRAGAGQGGSDRIEITWGNGAIKNTWLQVIVRGNDALGGSNANTGLAASDVFYFGNAVGDSGAADSGAYSVTSADEISARGDPHGVGNPAAISNVNDFNRDGLVNSSDQITSRSNTTTLGTQLKVLSIGAGGPFAPQSQSAVPAFSPSAILAPQAQSQPGQSFTPVAPQAASLADPAAPSLSPMLVAADLPRPAETAGAILPSLAPIEREILFSDPIASIDLVHEGAHEAAGRDSVSFDVVPRGLSLRTSLSNASPTTAAWFVIRDANDEHFVVHSSSQLALWLVEGRDEIVADLDDAESETVDDQLLEILVVGRREPGLHR